MADTTEQKSTRVREVLRAHSRNSVHPYFIARPDKDSAKASWTVAALCKEYNWPENLTGGGVIALIHCSGGHTPEDRYAYFCNAKLPEPEVSDHSVDDGITHNSKLERADRADTEVALDIQIAGAAYAIATGKPATIRIYWSKDLAAGLRAASDDDCDVCCITWGADEASWGKEAAYAFDAVAEAATAKGMIIVAASGDNDSSDGGSTPANVDFPASSPHVIGCGGTTRTKGAKATEKVWNDREGAADGNGTGGGVSEFFPIPEWQLGTLQSVMRIVPDVAAHADPNNGYQIIVGGEDRVVGGTSAATALYAALFAAFGKRRGFILPELYKNQICFNDIRIGDNGQFSALVGPDACTGLGSPKADRLAKRIGSDGAALERLQQSLKKNLLANRSANAYLSVSAAYAPSSTILAPREASPATTCHGWVLRNSDPNPSKSKIATFKSIIVQLANPSANPSTTKPDQALIGRDGWLISGNAGSPLWDFAKTCMATYPFCQDHLQMQRGLSRCPRFVYI